VRVLLDENLPHDLIAALSGKTSRPSKAWAGIDPDRKAPELPRHLLAHTPLQPTSGAKVVLH